ncbi:MAG: hypothetical protein H7222_17560 [Methylotenera sp.]|nr:hypothetical protein [Oligoflexia bacterium]
MKNSILSALCVTSLLVASVSFAEEAAKQPEPANTHKGGTMKGAAVGGLGGAAVGHPVAGAAVGAVVGHHRRHKAEKEAAKQAKGSPSNAAAPAPDANATH